MLFWQEKNGLPGIIGTTSVHCSLSRPRKKTSCRSESPSQFPPIKRPKKLFPVGLSAPTYDVIHPPFSSMKYVVCGETVAVNYKSQGYLAQFSGLESTSRQSTHPLRRTQSSREPGGLNDSRPASPVTRMPAEGLK